jgi:hypothetical protein
MQTIHNTRTVPRVILDYYSPRSATDFVQHVVQEAVRQVHNEALGQGRMVLEMFFSATSEPDNLHITVTGISLPLPPMWVKGDDEALADKDYAMLVQALSPPVCRNDEETV